jgi:AcrR family transcriptional regulator
MARRGDQLREHILLTAKDVFLELGFERASMDVVSARAQTSKRSLYAHFESKEKLYLAVIELVRSLFLERLRTPADYSDKPAEALVQFCARYVEILLHQSAIQMCRISMAETARFPEGAAEHFDVMFTEVHTRLNSYLKTTFDLSAKASADAAQKLLSQLLYPRLVRALFGIDVLQESFGQEALSPSFDLKPVRKAVDALLAAL